MNLQFPLEVGTVAFEIIMRKRQSPRLPDADLLNMSICYLCDLCCDLASPHKLTASALFRVVQLNSHYCNPLLSKTASFTEAIDHMILWGRVHVFKPDFTECWKSTYILIYYLKFHKWSNYKYFIDLSCWVHTVPGINITP